MKEIVFLLEEPSAKEMLLGLLPRITPQEQDLKLTYIVFEGKTDLEKLVSGRFQSH